LEYLMLTEFKLNLIAKRAKKDKYFRFNNVMQLVNEWSLRASFYKLNKTKAAGIDKVTLRDYEKNLSQNISDLVSRMKNMSYRPQAVKRVYIPKGNGKLRGLGIPAVEDRMVQLAMSKVLEAIYEQDFCEFSYGFRPGRNCHQALAAINQTLYRKPVNWVIDADIKGFFDNVDHGGLMGCLEKRVTDSRFLRYIMRFLKSGIMEEGQRYSTEVGTPQGGVISPILANIYLHYALDSWFCGKAVNESQGYVKLVRYADDFVICVQYKEDADYILESLKKRLCVCHLELSEEKTRMVRIGRESQEKWEAEKLMCKKGSIRYKPGTFTFLGFTHYCCRNGNAKYKFSRKTDKQRFARSVRSLKSLLQKVRSNMKLKDIWHRVCQILRGHYRYYGVTDNFLHIWRFYREAENLLQKWLNRRSQRRSMCWDKFVKYLKAYPLPRPRIYHDLRNYSPKT